jgi:hypothetical protein
MCEKTAGNFTVLCFYTPPLPLQPVIDSDPGSGGASDFENPRLALSPASSTISLLQSRNSGAL